MRVSRAAILQQGAAFGIGRGDVRHVRWLSRARSDCYASDMRQVRRLSRAGGVVMSVTSVTPPTCATRDGSRGRAATVTRPTRATRDGSRERAAWSDLLHRRRAPRATALKGAQRLLRVRRAPRATALKGGRGGRRGPRVDARVHHQPSEASGQQKRHAHAVSRAWLTRGE